MTVAGDSVNDDNIGTLGASTVAVALPVFPSARAMIIAVALRSPLSETADTTPALETVATLGALELQTTTRSVRTLLFASLSVAMKACADPTTSDDRAGVTTM
jgi:hypothetical protein